MKKRLERANKASSELQTKKGKYESYGFGSSAPRFEDIILTASPGARSTSQLNLSALRKTTGDETDHGNVCPRFHAYHRRAVSAHAGKLTQLIFYLSSNPRFWVLILSLLLVKVVDTFLRALTE